MPTYQYACTQCDHRFERVQAFSDDALTACHECGGALRKVYSAVGVVFKGSGFYRNDSRPDTSGSKGTDSGAKEPAAKTADSSSSSSSGEDAAKPAAAAASGSAPAAASSTGSSGSSTSKGAA